LAHEVKKSTGLRKFFIAFHAGHSRKREPKEFGEGDHRASSFRWTCKSVSPADPWYQGDRRGGRGAGLFSSHRDPKEAGKKFRANQGTVTIIKAPYAGGGNFSAYNRTQETLANGLSAAWVHKCGAEAQK